MKLSEKLRELQKEAFNDELTFDAIEDGFNRCIEDAEYLEWKARKMINPKFEKWLMKNAPELYESLMGCILEFD